MAPGSKRKVVSSPEMPPHLKNGIDEQNDNNDQIEDHAGNKPDDPERDHRSRTRSRSRSGSRVSESDNPRRHRRHRQRESRRSHSPSRSPPRRSSFDSHLMQSMINSSISNALLPLQQQLMRMSSVGNDADQFQSLRQQQKLLAIETQSSHLVTPGGKSQYRYLAKIQLFINNAIEALDNDENDIESVRQHLSTAASFASERLDLVLRADADPKYGWKALSLFEEKQRHTASNSDPETAKTWASCIKAAQDMTKKPAPKPDRPPFRSRPVSQSGRNSTQGYITLSPDYKLI